MLFVFKIYTSLFYFYLTESQCQQPVDEYSNKNGHYPICHDVNEIMVSQNVLPVVVGYENGMLVCYNPLKSKPFATVNHSVS